jgi:carboxyl-terminal processing protease
MLKELDPYTVYYHEANIEDYRLMTTGQYGGIGALIGNLDNEIHITDPYEGNPAQKAGIQAGDKILRIDRKPMSGKSVEEASNALKGPKGTTVSLELERNGQILTLDIVRDEIKIPDVPYSGMLTGTTGYISLSSFTQTAGEEIKKNIQDLQSKGMTNMILDLRGNGGGLLIEAVKIVGFFVPKGQVVVTTKGRSKQENMVYKTLEAPIAEKLPLVILIDEGSASASEIVAGALQDLDRAVVVGNTSYGKGLVQQDQILRDGSSVRMTVSRYYMPSGRSIQRSYSGDYDAYMRDEARYIKGELFSKDSIYLDKTKTYKTKNGRKVFGGGGVVPDEFVPLDTAGSSFYLTALNVNQVFSAYVFKSLQFNRGKWKTARSLGAYAFTSADLEAFTGFAYKTYKISGYELLSKPARARITQQLKVEFARQLWDETGVYQVNVLEDKELQLALRKLN